MVVVEGGNKSLEETEDALVEAADDLLSLKVKVGDVMMAQPVDAMRMLVNDHTEVLREGVVVLGESVVVRY